jgi:hypothetical protein
MSDLKIDILGINFNSCRRGSRGTVLQATWERVYYLLLYSPCLIRK